MDRTTAEAEPDDDGLVLAGGVANADRLRTDAAAVEFAAHSCTEYRSRSSATDRGS